MHLLKLPTLPFHPCAIRRAALLVLLPLLTSLAPAQEAPAVDLTSAELGNHPVRRVGVMTSSGPVLYVAQMRTLFAIDIEDARHPQLITQTELPTRITALAAGPGIVYAGLQNSGLAVLSLTSSTLELTTVTETSSRIGDLHVRGDLLFAAAQNLFIYRLGPDGAPTLLSSLAIGPSGRLALGKDMGYWLAPGPQGFAALHLDLTDPTVPKLSMHPLEMDWRSAVLTTATLDVASTGSARLAYVGDQSSFHIFRIDQPLAPQRLGSVSLSATPTCITLEEGRACVAAGRAGMILIDVHDPHAPAELGVYFPNGQALQVVLRGETALVLDDLGLLDVITLIQPADPQRIGGLSLQPASADPGD